MHSGLFFGTNCRIMTSLTNEAYKSVVNSVNNESDIAKLSLPKTVEENLKRKWLKNYLTCKESFDEIEREVDGISKKKKK